MSHRRTSPHARSRVATVAALGLGTILWSGCSDVRTEVTGPFRARAPGQ